MLNNEIELRNQIIASVWPHFAPLRKYGADHLGYRYFKPDGSSFGLTTNDKWYQITRTAEFFDLQKSHLEDEICDLFVRGDCYVTRSREDTDNLYFKALNIRDMSNSVGIYLFSAEKIEHFFFISESKDHFSRDILINHLEEIKNVANKLSKKISKAFTKLSYIPSPEFYLSRKIMNFIFNEQGSTKSLPDHGMSISTNRKVQHFTKRELEIISWLRFDCSSRFIAEELDISVRTVENHIKNIKYKSGYGNREKLRMFANKQEFKCLFGEKK